MPLLDDHAGQAAQHHLDPAELVDSAPRTVDILEADAGAFHRGFELAQVAAELAPQVLAVGGIDLDAHGADERGCSIRRGGTDGPILRLAHLLREGRAPRAVGRSNAITPQLRGESSVPLAPSRSTVRIVSRIPRARVAGRTRLPRGAAPLFLGDGPGLRGRKTHALTLRPDLG